jgi:outer membrane protein assembly factor BamB
MLPRCLWCLAVLAGGFALAAPAPSNPFTPREFDWPQWQGKDRTAISKEKGLLQDWPKEGPKQLWKATNLGIGFSTPSVAAGRIFLMGNRQDQEVLLALSEAEEGKELWVTELATVKGGGGGYPGPRCTPTVDGDLVYALGLKGDLICCEVAKGEIKWRKNLRKDFQGSVGGWEYSESPLIDGDKLLCTPGGKNATLVALNMKTGDLVWKGPVPEGDGAHYSSIVAADVAGKRQYIQFLSRGVVGLSADGQFLWRFNKPANGTANCTTPIFQDNCVLAASSYDKGAGLVQLLPEGDKIEAKEVYYTDKMKNHHGGLVLLDGHAYGEGSGRLACIEFKTGDIKWKAAGGQAGKGSVAFADNRLYYRDEGGRTYLVEANAEKYVEHGRFDPPRSGQPAWPHPVIANGRLYIRDQDFLLCYDVKAK